MDSFAGLRIGSHTLGSVQIRSDVFEKHRKFARIKSFLLVFRDLGTLWASVGHVGVFLGAQGAFWSPKRT